MIKYYAVAKNSHGKIEQLLVVRNKLIGGGSNQISQTWTGVIYKEMKDACGDLERLNCNE